MALPPVGYLVWIKNPTPNPKHGRGPAICAKWPLNPIEATTKDKIVLAKHPLNADEWAMSLLILEQRYPAPAVPEGTL